MEINNIPSFSKIGPQTAPPQRESRAQPARSDNIKTSSEFQIFARNLSALKKQMAPRNEVLNRFDGIADRALELDDHSIDQILSKILPT